MEKIKNTIKHYAKKRDIILLLVLGIGYDLLTLLIYLNVPAILSYILSFLLLIATIGIVLLVYLARWYKDKTGESLYGALISPDREGGLLQLVYRARKLKVDSNRNKSKGLYTKRNVNGIILGRDENGDLVSSPSQREEHAICFGGSGSGKTSFLLCQTLKHFLGGVFAIDISGDIQSALKKFNVATINPHSPYSCAFNVFAHIDDERDNSKKIIMLKKLANLVIPECEPTKTGDGVYFQQGAHLLFYSALIYYYSKGYDFCDSCYLIINKSANKLVSMLKGNNSPANAKIIISDFAALRDTNLASMKQTLDAYISVFATSRPIKAILHRNNKTNQRVISAKELEKRDVYLNIPQKEIVFFAPLMKLISGLVLDYCGSRPLYPERKILIALDEFSSLGFIDILPPLANLRKHGARILILTQSLSDIDVTYGITKRKIILDNCGIKIILNASDKDTQEYFSQLVGTREVLKKTQSYSDGEFRITYSIVEKPIFLPEELGYLRDDCIVLLPDGYMKLKKAYYFKDNLSN